MRAACVATLLEDGSLSTALSDLTFQLGEWEWDEANAALQSRSVDALNAVIARLSAYPLINTDNLTALAAAPTVAGFCNPLAALTANLTSIEQRMIVAGLRPGYNAALTNTPVTYTLTLENQGSLTAAYRTTLRLTKLVNQQIANEQIVSPGATFTTTVAPGPDGERAGGAGTGDDGVLADERGDRGSWIKTPASRKAQRPEHWDTDLHGFHGFLLQSVFPVLIRVLICLPARLLQETQPFTHYEENNTWMYGGSWSTVVVTQASGGYVRRAAAASSTAQLTFSGVWAHVGFVTAPGGGSVAVFMDGQPQGVINTSSAITAVAGAIYSALGTGTHVLTLTAQSAAPVLLDFAVPPVEPPSWLTHNTYRTQAPTLNPAPVYQIDLTYTVPLSGVAVLTPTFSAQPDTAAPAFHWNYTQYWYEPARVTSFDAQLPALQPGEVRQVGAQTELEYCLTSGCNRMSLAPLYVSAAHIVALEPYSATAGAGSQTRYAATLSNPAATPAVYSLTLAGLPPAWGRCPPRTRGAPASNKRWISSSPRRKMPSGSLTRLPSSPKPMRAASIRHRPN